MPLLSTFRKLENLGEKSTPVSLKTIVRVIRSVGQYEQGRRALCKRSELTFKYSFFFVSKPRLICAIYSLPSSLCKHQLAARPAESAGALSEVTVSDERLALLLSFPTSDCLMLRYRDLSIFFITVYHFCRFFSLQV